MSSEDKAIPSQFQQLTQTEEPRGELVLWALRVFLIPGASQNRERVGSPAPRFPRPLLLILRRAFPQRKICKLLIRLQHVEDLRAEGDPGVLSPFRSSPGYEANKVSRCARMASRSSLLMEGSVRDAPMDGTIVPPASGADSRLVTCPQPEMKRRRRPASGLDDQLKSFK